MQIVNVFSDDSQVRRTLMVQSPCSLCTFEPAFRGALDDVKTEHPSDWQSDDILEKMREDGWQIIDLSEDVIEVEY
jgi:hypothetical protein